MHRATIALPVVTAATVGVLVLGLFALLRPVPPTSMLPATVAQVPPSPSTLEVATPGIAGADRGGAGETPAAGDDVTNRAPERVTATASPAPTASPSPVPPAAEESVEVAAAAPDDVAPWSVEVHSGLGAWIDVYDWSMWGTEGNPVVTVDTIDALAAQGVRTIYLQTTRANVPDPVLEPERIRSLIDRAHEHGMFVTGWYLAEFTDPDEDFARFEAAMSLPLDGFALDIESQALADPAERSRRLLDLSARLRAVAGDRVLVANVLPPIQMEELAPSLWPGFPWAELGEYYEVFMPMGYFTFREDGHHWRDAEAYTARNVELIRERVGDPDLPVHFIGGIADLTSVADVEGMTRGALSSGAIGLSLYDVATTGTELWAPMQAWRELR